MNDHDTVQSDFSMPVSVRGPIGLIVAASRPKPPDSSRLCFLPNFQRLPSCRLLHQDLLVYVYIICSLLKYVI